MKKILLALLVLFFSGETAGLNSGSVFPTSRGN